MKGEDGFFTPSFLDQDLSGRVRTDGSVDFHDRSSLISASLNEVLGVYRGPTEGEPGSTVLGKKVPAKPGKDLPPKLGKGVEMRDEGRVFATCMGVVTYRSGAILEVSDAFEHRGDVDLKSGDLKMEGSIVVTGAVTQNAKVIARGSIVVKGMVDGGSVESDGPITVMGGVVGEETASVRSGGDVVCRHSQGARIECIETLTIEQFSINSFLKARMILSGTPGERILGGAAPAVEKIVVGEAGSKLGARTALSVAMLLNWEYDTAASKLKKERLKAGRNSDRKSRRPRPVTSRKDGADAERRLVETACIVVTGTIYPGVVIEIGRLSMTIEKEMRGVRFFCSTDKEPRIDVQPCISQHSPSGSGKPTS